MASIQAERIESKLIVYHADFMHSGNQDAENLVDEWCTFLERCGGVEDVYFMPSQFFLLMTLTIMVRHYQRKLRLILEPLMKMRHWKTGLPKSWPNERKELRPGSHREWRGWGVMLRRMCLVLLQALLAALHFLAPL